MAMPLRLARPVRPMRLVRELKGSKRVKTIEPRKGLKVGEPPWGELSVFLCVSECHFVAPTVQAHVHVRLSSRLSRPHLRGRPNCLLPQNPQAHTRW